MYLLYSKKIVLRILLRTFFKTSKPQSVNPLMVIKKQNVTELNSRLV